MSILRNSLILFALLISPVHAETKPLTGLLICTCGDPVTLIVNENGNIKIIPATLFNEKTMKILMKWCHKGPIPVWKSEEITGKACPISI